MLASFATAQETRAPLTPAQKAVLARYESVRAGLAADDLATAKKAAAELAELPGADAATARKLAAADSLSAARDAFKPLSKSAVMLAAGQPGYIHALCPMVPRKEGDWVQTSKTISNPYYGKSMLTCGSIVN